MHLTVLIFLLAVTVSQSIPHSSTSKQATMTPARTTLRTTSFHKTTIQDISPSSVKTTNITRQQKTERATPAGTSSLRPPPATPSQTPNGTEEVTHPTPPARSTTTNQTVTLGSTVPAASPNDTATPSVNTTSPVLTHDFKKGDLVGNPGLVAVLCIFCIILFLVLVVATVKCIHSPKSNFERLDDVPMERVNESSPFAQHSK
ncbi:putative LOC729966 homolog [Aulostomus maculatus]